MAFEQERTQLKGTDAYGSMDAVDEWQQSTREQYLKGLDDPKLSRDVEAHIAAKGLSLKGSLSRHEAQQRNAVADETRTSVLRTNLKSAYLGSGTLDENVQEYTAAIASDPTLSDEEKENNLVSGQSAIASARIEGIIDRNPDAAIALMDSGLFREFLSAQALSTFAKKAHQASKTRERDAKAQATEAKRKAKEELEAQQDATGNEFVELLADGDLTQETIEKSPLDPTGENSKQYWSGLISKRGKQTDKPWKTDPAVERELIGRILEDPNGESAGAVTDSVLLEQLGPDGITSSTLKGLRKFRDGLKSDPLKTDQAQTAIASLNAAKKAKLFDAGNPVENVRKWGEATELLKRYLVNYPDKDPAEYVDSLIEKGKFTFWDTIFGNTDTLRAEQEAVLEEEAGPPIGGGVSPVPGEWMNSARAMNPGASDVDLEAFYRGKYGNR